jgi:uncharacterized protein
VTSDPQLDRLRDLLSGYRRLIVAFSGGADSALLAAAAAEVLGEQAVAVTAVSPSLATSERANAKDFCRRYDIRHVEVCTDEDSRPEYIANDGDRCYHCKSALFDALEPLASLLQAPVALGTNLDDLSDHRPGLRAASERGAVAPLVEAGFTKHDVREASLLLGLVTADKPAAACLASRVAYGEEVTPHLLHRLELAEAALHELGFSVCRVRSHGNGSVARVELPTEQFDRAIAHRTDIETAVRSSGFTFVALDLGGFASGRLNAMLQPQSVRLSRRATPSLTDR